ncbi:hypothetical protein Mycch_1067 [Mycolicibacterium chubuense NBB4]|uniref:Uncharacterized protein n=1 Tax=Mycolicibacterium chubuense (strain NBB4) TaxID=710421 RepID=I4BF20_MYCCN|nr:hypothetical protein [Mycolicibacterium chubuense]AFM15877.1 hypothetical protein Mycch_1067 [Mycolicibacterium chubuense NBB4]
MAQKYDAASRLAEGRPAVDDVAQYVWACRALGYGHPDLTEHGAQLRDWYGTEDGMDLAVLQEDCVALEGAARACQDALSAQERALSSLPGAWQGAGAQAAGDFLRRHGEASAAAATAVRAAAEAVTALRDELWRAVDEKVGAVVSIAGRAGADWRQAAATVTTGAGDRAAASEVIDTAVKPFVDTVIRTEWLAAMRAAMAAVTDAYRDATAEITAEPQPVFDVPGDLGPDSSPPTPAPCGQTDRAPGPGAVSYASGPAPTTPSAWSAPAAPATVPPAVSAPMAAAPMAAAPMAAAPPPPAEAALPQPAPVPSAPPMPALGGMGSGMPGLPDPGGGLSGLAQQFADTLSALLGGGGDGPLPGPAGLDPPDPGVAEDGSIDGSDHPAGETDQSDETDTNAEDPEPAPEPGAEPEPVEPAADEPVAQTPCDDPPGPAVDTVAAPAPTPAPPPAEPLPPAEPPPAEPLAADQTPCAIAADEVPQVGPPR